MTTTVPRDPVPVAGTGLRYGRDTTEFGRVVNLSDAVFAIALTLLVLTLDTPRLPADQVAAALRDQLPGLAAFAISFVLIASIWWTHHKFFRLLGWIDAGMIAINLALLGAVALVPFPTSLVGHTPASRAAALPFIALFVLIMMLFVALLLRTWRVNAWSRPVPDGLLPWLLGDWLANLGLVLLALAVAVRAPLVGLGILVSAGTVTGIAMSVLKPEVRREWV